MLLDIFRAIFMITDYYELFREVGFKFGSLKAQKRTQLQLGTAKVRDKERSTIL